MLDSTPRLIVQSTTPAVSGRIADSYARSVSVNEFDESGVMRGSMSADTLRRFSGEGIVELDEPERHNYTDDGVWFASARTGPLREKTDVLLLSEEVRLQYDTENVQFFTESMIINIPKQAARSTSSVRIWQADNETVADQIYVNLSRQIATLSGDVRTVYVPQN